MSNPERGSNKEKGELRTLDLELRALTGTGFQKLRENLAKRYPEKLLVFYDEIKEAILQEHGAEKIAVVAQIKFAEGKKPIIAVRKDPNSEPLAIPFGVNSWDIENPGRVFYAEVELPDDPTKKAKARIVAINMVLDANYILISRGLSELLTVKEEDRKIRITRIYEDTSKINLDEKIK